MAASYRYVLRVFLERDEIVKRINAGFKILPKRWVVERTFAWLARYRHLAKDYERKTKHSEATTYIASCKSCSPSL